MLLQGDEATADPIGTVGTCADMAIEVRLFSGDFSKVICASAGGSDRLPLPCWPSLKPTDTRGFVKSWSRSGKLLKFLLHFYVLRVNVSVQEWAWNTSERRCGRRSEGSLWEFVLSSASCVLRLALKRQVDCKHFYLPSQLTSPRKVFESQNPCLDFQWGCCRVFINI